MTVLHLVAGIAMLANVHAANAPHLVGMARLSAAPATVARIAPLDAQPQAGPAPVGPPVGPGDQPSAPPVSDTTTVKGFDPMRVPDTIDWAKITSGFQGLIRHFGGVIAACLGLLFILMLLWAGVLYQFNSGNTRAVDQVRTKVKHIMEGAFIALGAGFFFAVITLIASTFQGA